MVYFQTVKKILHTLGLYDITDSYPVVTYVKYMIIVLFLFTTFLTSFHFVVFNASDMQKTSTALFAANIMLISSIYFTMLFGQKTALRQLLDRIEAVAETRIFLKFSNSLQYSVERVSLMIAVIFVLFWFEEIVSRPQSVSLYMKAEEKITAVSLFIVEYCCIALPAYCIILGLIPLITSFTNTQPMLFEMYPAR